MAFWAKYEGTRYLPANQLHVKAESICHPPSFFQSVGSGWLSIQRDLYQMTRGPLISLTILKHLTELTPYRQKHPVVCLQPYRVSVPSLVMFPNTSYNNVAVHEQLWYSTFRYEFSSSHTTDFSIMIFLVLARLPTKVMLCETACDSVSSNPSKCFMGSRYLANRKSNKEILTAERHSSSRVRET